MRVGRDLAERDGVTGVGHDFAWSSSRLTVGSNRTEKPPGQTTERCRPSLLSSQTVSGRPAGSPWRVPTSGSTSPNAGQTTGFPSSSVMTENVRRPSRSVLMTLCEGPRTAAQAEVARTRSTTAVARRVALSATDGDDRADGVGRIQPIVARATAQRHRPERARDLSRYRLPALRRPWAAVVTRDGSGTSTRGTGSTPTRAYR